MKKIILLSALLATSLFANDVEKFFNASNENYIFCRAGYETYVKLSQNNASIKTINGTKYFQYKQKDYYFPLSGCKSVKKTDEGVIF
ncbi:MAG: hypothetical protein DRP93_08045 [Candidatus Neomarinimicrobiota bacterium]|nr:MAG: hypothetical protein DRP93_08045 [Candidatus Neomarinimicrobiota bacterium]